MDVRTIKRWLAPTVAGLALAVPASAGAVVLYDQTDNAVSPPIGMPFPNYAPSNYYSPMNDHRVADDFTVPEGEVWTIEEVDAPGYSAGSNGGFNVLIYPDAGGVPGAPLFEQHGIQVGAPGSCICLTGTPPLPAGKYWVTVQLNSHSGGLPFTWGTRSVMTGEPAKYMEAVPGCSGATGPWANRASCFPSDNLDQTFKLSGKTAPPAPPVGSSAFTLGARTLDRRKGTATQVVTVPGAGSVELTGEDVAPQSAPVSGAGDVALKIKPRGKLKRRLKRKGKAKATLSVSFTPTGGSASSQAVPVELKRKVKKRKGA